LVGLRWITGGLRRWRVEIFEMDSRDDACFGWVVELEVPELGHDHTSSDKHPRTTADSSIFFTHANLQAEEDRQTTMVEFEVEGTQTGMSRRVHTSCRVSGAQACERRIEIVGSDT
jgi:hypothetical protein